MEFSIILDCLKSALSHPELVSGSNIQAACQIPNIQSRQAETEKANKALSTKPDYDTYKKTLEDIVRFYEKVKPTADMIEQYRDHIEGNPGMFQERKRVLL